MALERIGANFTHHFVCEFDKYAISSYNAVHNTDFRVKDIRDVKGNDLNISNIKDFTYLLTYSFPCTDLSLMSEGYRIRKLTPRECGRLMGVSDENITKMMNVNSNSQCYKQFGNSIVVDVLVAQFSQLGIKGIERWNDKH